MLSVVFSFLKMSVVFVVSCVSSSCFVSEALWNAVILLFVSSAFVPSVLCSTSAEKFFSVLLLKKQIVHMVIATVTFGIFSSCLCGFGLLGSVVDGKFVNVMFIVNVV